MIRNKYKKRQTGIISTKNEPFPYKYPDMYDTYKKFSKTFNIPINNFILTNGCENAFRISLIALRIKEISLEDPSWELTKIICEGFDIKYQRLKYEYVNNQFEIMDKPIYKYVYLTDTYNNLFFHKNKTIDDDKTVILDETYTLKKLHDKNRKLKDNEIIIGSFSKFVDPSLRIGYILFNDKYEERFNLLREEYISSLATNYILNLTKINTNIIERPELLNNKNIISIHNTYITLDKKPKNRIPYKEFTVSNKKFYRVSNNPFIGTIL